MSSSIRDQIKLGPAKLQELGEGIFAYVQPDGTWWINNTGFLVGKKRIVAIDSCATELRTRALQEAIASISKNPVQTLINTHHHGDHTHGNYLFTEATIVAHERCRDEIIAEGPPASAKVASSGAWSSVDWGAIEVAPPFLTYHDEVDVYVDDLQCHVAHVGTPAHTTNDSIVWIPEHSILFSGDLLFNGGTPFLLSGSIEGAVVALRGLKELGARTIVPGHGPVSGPELIDDVLAYLLFVQDVARRGKAAGLAPLEAAHETDLGRFRDLTDAERIVGNLHRAYAELDGAAPGARIDMGAALRDMVTYNGGHPLSCLA